MLNVIEGGMDKVTELLSTPYEDIRGSVIHLKDIVRLDYVIVGVTKRDGFKKVVEFEDGTCIDLNVLVRCFHVEVIDHEDN